MLPLSNFLTSYYRSQFPHGAPTISVLLYERGAGEGTSREREKEAPARALWAYDRTTALPPSAVSEPRTQARLPHSHHSLLFVRDEEALLDDDINVRMSMLWMHPRAVLATNLLDSHVYILDRRSVIPLLRARAELTSLREHLVPTVAKCSWQKMLRQKIGWPARLPAAGRTRKQAQGAGVAGGSGGASDEEEEAEEDEDEGMQPTSMLSAYLKSTNVHNLPARKQLQDIAPSLTGAPVQQPQQALPSSTTSSGAELSGQDMLRETSQAMFDHAARVDQEEAKLLEVEPPIRCIAMIARLKPRYPGAGGVEAVQGSGAQAGGSGGSGSGGGSGGKGGGGGGGGGAGQDSKGENAGAEGFIARANTLPTYMECNRHMLKVLAGDAPASARMLPMCAGASHLDGPYGGAGESGAQASGAAGGSAGADNAGASGTAAAGTGSESTGGATAGGIDAKAQISPDSLVGGATSIAERTTVKRSVIGKHCRVGRNVRIQGCILMDGVVVAEGAKLENCVLCSGASVGERSTLKDCDVGPGYAVEPDSSAKNEKFAASEFDEPEQE